MLALHVRIGEGNFAAVMSRGNQGAQIGRPA
jgi:hypothetical protein